jgi:hypothetical protein
LGYRFIYILEIIPLFRLTLSISNEGHYRNAQCALHLISTVLLAESHVFRISYIT